MRSDIKIDNKSKEDTAKSIVVIFGTKNDLLNFKKIFHTLIGYTKTEYGKIGYTIDELDNISRNEKIHSKFDFIDEGSFCNCNMTFLLYSY